jgi:hypothetical protein
MDLSSSLKSCSEVAPQIEEFWIYALEIELFVLVAWQNFTIEVWQKKAGDRKWVAVPDF